jgi:uncharacterized RDD family membrane protein YckC
MPVIEIATPFNIDLEFEIADFPRRFFAYIIDFALLIIYTYGMRYVLHGTLDYFYTERWDPQMCKDIIFISVPMLFYSLFCELWMNGQTVGKKILNIKVISLDGGEPTLGQYLSRWITKFYELPFIFGIAVSYGMNPNPLPGIISTCFCGIVVVIIIAVSKKSQRLGDMVAGTVIVNTKSKLTVHDTIFMNVEQPDYKVKFPEALRLTDRDINTIKNVIAQTQKNNNNHDMCNRVAIKVKEVLNISDDMYSIDFLEKIIADYNYLATRE